MIDSSDILNTTATAPTDIDRLRRQARQRFIGAGVLVFIAVVGLPFLLDSKPRPVSPNIAIEIPKTAPVQATPAVASQPVVQPPVVTASAAPAVAEIASPPTAVPTPVTAQAPSVVPAKPDDGARAAALLEGQTPAAGYAIQAGSYTDKVKLHEVEIKLEKAGLTHYTQDATAKNGTRHTRVRLGPFATQQEANSVAVKVNKLGIKTIVIKP